MTPRAVIARTTADGWKGVQVAGTPPEPWLLGERLLSKTMRYRGDLPGLLGDLFSFEDKAWDRVGDPSDRLTPKQLQPADWLYLFDDEARTLTIQRGDGETFLVSRLVVEGADRPLTLIQNWR